MARRRPEVDELARRILALDVAERAKLIARLMVAGERETDWSAITRIQRRTQRHSPSEVGRRVDKAVAEVRRERQRSP
jgi:hypothetical protein